MSKLVLIDGNAILHRAYHALPVTLTTPSGQPINAVYGFVSMLIRIINDLKPTHLAVAFDTAKPTFRHAEYVGYQAQRPRTDSELSSQFKIIYKVLNCMHIPIYQKEGYEADDILGTVAHQTKEDMVIVTGDRDILQLVDDRVKVYMPVKGLTTAKLYGADEVHERMGVPPSQIVDYKALVGDPSDNYPGVSGIGPKSAGELLAKYKTLEGIYANLREIPEKLATKLAIGAEPAGLAKKLATIVKNVPVTFKLKESANWDLASPATLKLFQRLGFKTLTGRVQQTQLI